MLIAIDVPDTSIIKTPSVTTKLLYQNKAIKVLIAPLWGQSKV